MVLIGKGLDESVRLDVPSLVTSRLLICANSGGGKSYALRGLAEQVGKGRESIPVVVLDPEGEFSTLREILDMVLVGPGGEVAADVRSAKLLARKLVELRVSAVVDISELSLVDRRRFVRLFCESLVSLPKKLWHPTLFVLDEAHKFCPERGHGQSESTDAVISLMAQGRKRGYCGLLATQRLSKLHKDAVGECNNVMVGRCVQDVDVRRAADLLGLRTREAGTTLRALLPGEFYAFGPAFSFPGIERFRTVPVQTTHPDSKNRGKIEPTAPSVKIRKVLGELADLPAQAEAEVKDIVAARVRINQLQKALARAERDAGLINSADLDHLKAVIAGWEQWSRSVFGWWEKVQAEMSGCLPPKPPGDRPKPRAKRPNGRDESVTFHASPMVSDNLKRAVLAGLTKSEAEDADLPPAARKILSALAEYPDGLDAKRLGFLAGVGTSGGTWGRAIRYIRDHQLATRNGGVWKIRPAGRELVGEPEPRPRGAALLDYWCERLQNRAAASMLQVLANRGPIDKGDLAEAAGVAPTGGTWGRAMKELRARGLIVGRGSGPYDCDPALGEALAS